MRLVARVPRFLGKYKESHKKKGLNQYLQQSISQSSRVTFRVRVVTRKVVLSVPVKGLVNLSLILSLQQCFSGLLSLGRSIYTI